MKRKLLIGVLLVMTLSARADFVDAMDYYKSGNYQQAYDEFLKLAKLGEKRAQFNLGNVLSRATCRKRFSQCYSLAFGSDIYLE
ncbi:MAG: hypothetical protein V2I33_13895 [Kangiellaceae bacterium]|jgi:hypothetical protein|nr:hypothetical protein [Kangiellaceae bacterium]